MHKRKSIHLKRIQLLVDPSLSLFLDKAILPFMILLFYQSACAAVMIVKVLIIMNFTFFIRIQSEVADFFAKK